MSSINNNLSAFTPIKFSLKLVEILYNQTLYPFITNTNYEGIIKDSGDRVRVRTAARITLSDYQKNTTLVKQALTPTYEDLIIDIMKYFAFGVDDVDKMQNDIDAITQYANNARRDLTEYIDTDLLSYMRKNVDGDNATGTSYSTSTVSVAATTGVVTGVGTTFTAGMVGGYFKWTGGSYYLVTAFSSTTSITVKDLDGVAYTGGVEAASTYVINAASATTLTKNNVYSQIVNLRTVLGQKLTPTEGRFLAVNSAFEGVLLQAPEFIPAVQTAYNQVVEQGLIGSIAGFKVYNTELIDGDNTTGYWFVAGTKEYCSFAAQIMKVSVVPSASDPSSFENTCKGLLVYGRKVFAGNRGRGAVLRAKF